jgi:Ca2+-binding EF-hand superfamily protein
MNTLDEDKDGYIGINDVLGMNKELGINLTEQKIKEIF